MNIKKKGNQKIVDKNLKIATSRTSIDMESIKGHVMAALTYEGEWEQPSSISEHFCTRYEK